jgi:predicted transcriptional regulator
MRRAGMVTRLDETRAGKSGRQMHVYAAASR